MLSAKLFSVVYHPKTPKVKDGPVILNRIYRGGFKMQLCQWHFIPPMAFYSANGLQV